MIATINMALLVSGASGSLSLYLSYVHGQLSSEGVFDGTDKELIDYQKNNLDGHWLEGYIRFLPFPLLAICMVSAALTGALLS